MALRPVDSLPVKFRAAYLKVFLDWRRGDLLRQLQRTQSYLSMQVIILSSFLFSLNIYNNPYFKLILNILPQAVNYKVEYCLSPC